VTPPEAVNVSPPKRAKISGSTVRVNDAAVDGGDHEGRRHTPSGYTVRGPEIVECDEPETISWAIELIQVDLAAHGALEVGKSSDKRTYALVGKLRDGPAWGQSLEPER
jgi:hypothetical protein